MPQSKADSKSIDGYVYTVYMLPPRTAMKLLMRMGKMLGPSLGPIADAVAGDVAKGGVRALLNFDADEEFFTKVAAGLFSRLDESVVENIIDELAGVTHVKEVGSDKEPELHRIFDTHFRGSLGSMSKWIAFALGVQYGNFFDALRSTDPPKLAEVQQ